MSKPDIVAPMPTPANRKRLYVLDDQRVPVRVSDFSAWLHWMEGESRFVAATPVGDAEVSTAFVGVDLAAEAGEPMLFETKVYGTRLHGEIRRCSTWGQAMLQHEAMIQFVKRLAD